VELEQVHDEFESPRLAARWVQRRARRVLAAENAETTDESRDSAFLCG